MYIFIFIRNQAGFLDGVLNIPGKQPLPKEFDKQTGVMDRPDLHVCSWSGEGPDSTINVPQQIIDDWSKTEHNDQLNEWIADCVGECLIKPADGAPPPPKRRKIDSTSVPKKEPDPEEKIEVQACHGTSNHIICINPNMA